MGFVLRVIQRPHISEDNAGQIACGHFLEDPLPELADQVEEGWRAEREELPNRIDGHVIVKESKTGPALQLQANRHLSDRGRPEEYDEGHAPNLL
jgi:hypothetical protein